MKQLNSMMKPATQKKNHNRETTKRKETKRKRRPAIAHDTWSINDRWLPPMLTKIIGWHPSTITHRRDGWTSQRKMTMTYWYLPAPPPSPFFEEKKIIDNVIFFFFKLNFILSKTNSLVFNSNWFHCVELDLLIRTNTMKVCPKEIKAVLRAF